MRTTFLLNQHQKCQCILEMLQRCEQYLFIAKSNLEKYLNTPMNERWIKYLFADEQAFRNVVSKYESIKTRLENYYLNNVHKIESHLPELV